MDAAGGDKALKIQHQPNISYVDGALITYYDHLNRTSLLALSQQGSHHIHAGSDDDKIMFARSYSPKDFISLDRVVGGSFWTVTVCMLKYSLLISSPWCLIGNPHRQSSFQRHGEQSGLESADLPWHVLIHTSILATSTRGSSMNHALSHGMTRGRPATHYLRLYNTQLLSSVPRRAVIYKTMTTPS